MRSLNNLHQAGVAQSCSGFFPDSTFACDIRDDAKARAFLDRVGLTGKRFICAIPRYRRTPAYRYYAEHRNPQTMADIDTFNAQWAEHDHARLRQVMIRWVRAEGGMVLTCPEIEYEREILRPMLIDPLPDDVKPFVVTHDDYWITDEAASVYAQAQAVVSMECHSVILAMALGRFAFYLRQPQDTWKGMMYPNLGLPQCTRNVEELTPEALADHLMPLLKDQAGSRAAVHTAMQQVHRLYEQAFGRVNQVLGGLSEVSVHQG